MHPARLARGSVRRPCAGSRLVEERRGRLDRRPEVGAATDELAGLRQEVERVAIEGGDTRAARERVAEAVAAQEDRETQRGHLERMLDRARQGRRRRAAFAEMAAVYEAQAADLRIVLEVNAAREVMEAAQARRRSVEPSGIVQRRVHGVLLGRGPKMQETPPAELVIEHVPFVTNADWQDQEQVLAQAERFERLAADARGEATG